MLPLQQWSFVTLSMNNSGWVSLAMHGRSITPGAAGRPAGTVQWWPSNYPSNVANFRYEASLWWPGKLAFLINVENIGYSIPAQVTFEPTTADVPTGIDQKLVQVTLPALTGAATQ